MTEAILSSEAVLSFPASRETSHRKRIVLFSVFGDESHDGNNAHAFAVAGVFGSDGDWESVKSEWLARTGGVVFHAAECETDVGDFVETETNKHADNLKLYRDLTQIICRSRLLAFGCCMDLAGYREVFPHTDVEVPYYRCFRDVIMHFAEVAHHSIEQEQVKFTFDLRAQNEYNAGALYNFMANLPENEWKHSKKLFQEISFASRKIPEIQVADLVARETMKHLENKVGPKKRPIRGSMRALLESKRLVAQYLMKDHFQEFARVHGEGMREYQEAYGQWLATHGQGDSISSKHRFSMEVDIPAFRMKTLQVDDKSQA